MSLSKSIFVIAGSFGALFAAEKIEKANRTQPELPMFFDSQKMSKPNQSITSEVLLLEESTQSGILKLKAQVLPKINVDRVRFRWKVPEGYSVVSGDPSGMISQLSEDITWETEITLQSSLATKANLASRNKPEHIPFHVEYSDGLAKIGSNAVYRINNKDWEDREITKGPRPRPELAQKVQY